ncbi:hypothetical protein QJS10_CPA09g00825 [Acorus calamus]|uniref:DNA-3-methyladenine glycosylase I n=1 Tax=Acorus calamus TaxID=4465 RepID=A0AAV9E6L1_ACOCL|nr:hypothetical protein QJS10_CPA09g00825 [Acorus calamus]
MCNSMIKSRQGHFATVDGRRVLQPTCNRVVVPPTSKDLVTLKKPVPKTITASMRLSPPISPKILRKSVKGSDEKPLSSPKLASSTKPIVRKNSNGLSISGAISLESSMNSSSSSSSSIDLKVPGSIAAARREEAMLTQARRKMRIAHYGRTKAKVAPIVVDQFPLEAVNTRLEKRCSFITSNSDPIYVAYHDEEWGVPVHDDNMLFELLVLAGAQVGSDWATVLKKRNDFRMAFSGFDPEIVSRFSERQIVSVSAQYRIDLGKVRGIVDNANRILDVQSEFGSLNAYLWGFVNHKPIATQYKSCRKIPVKTSKSESISKELVKRGFRYVGPTVVHSFMQAAGLTNDHLVTCPRHLHCSSSLSSPS